MSVARPANASTLRPPQSVRASASRPRPSVPSSAPRPGPSKGSPIVLAGGCPAKYGPASATSRTTTRRTTPIAPAGVRAKRNLLTRRRPQPRDEQQHEQVGEQVESDDRDGDQERDRLHRAHVADRDRVDELFPEPRVGEEIFDDDHAAEEVLQVLREDLHRRSERVPQCMTPHDPPLGEAVEPRHLGVLRAQRLDHARARHPHGCGERRAEQRQHGQDEQARMGERALPRVEQRDRRQRREPREQHEDEQRPDHELGERDDRERDDRDRHVCRTAGMARRDDAEQERERDHQERRDACEPQRRRQARMNLAPDRHAGAGCEARRRVAEVALHEPGQPVGVAHGNRAVETHVLAQLRNLGGRRGLAQHGGGGVARQHFGPGEDEHRDDEQRRQRGGRTAEQEPGNGAVVPDGARRRCAGPVRDATAHTHGARLSMP